LQRQADGGFSIKKCAEIKEAEVFDDGYGVRSIAIEVNAQVGIGYRAGGGNHDCTCSCRLSDAAASGILENPGLLQADNKRKLI
jgi:hypothetical protein